MNYRKTLAVSLAALAAAGLIAGCSGEKPAASKAAGSASKTTTIKVGVSPVPHEQIVNAVKDQLAKKGINVEIVEFTDYVQPNLALNDKSLDANFFQHKPYLDEFCKSRGLKLASVGAVHLEPMSVFSNKYKSLAELPDGASIAIPNDPTNGGRALLVLQSAGLIKLRDGAPVTATPQDIAENPHNLKFSELEAPQLPRSLADVDAAVININFALEAKLNPKDAIYTESKDSPYANIVAVRAGDENRPEIQELMKALTSPESKKFIEDTYKGAVIPAF